MQSLRLTTPLLLVTTLALAAGCGDSTGAEEGSEATAETGNTTEPTEGGCVEGEEVSEPITADTTWSCDKTLAGLVYVQDGATLTIDPGVTVRG